VRSAELSCHSLELSHDMSDDGSATTVRCIEIAAQVLEALDSTRTAVRLVAAATLRRDALGAPRPSVEQPELDRLLHCARDALGDSAFDAAWIRGRQSSIQEAVDLAAASLMTLVEGRSR
jgi:hypothetical protein